MRTLRLTLAGLAVCILLGFSLPAENSPQSGNSPRSMSFRLYANTVFFPVSVNGSAPLNFLLDTAAGGCVVNRSVVERLKLPILGEGEQANAGSGDKKTRIAVLPGATLTLEAARLDLSRLIAIPLDEVGNAYGIAVDGIIGYELMAQNTVIIDYDAGTLTLADPQTFSYSGTGAIVPLKVRSNGEPIVTIEVGVDEDRSVMADMLLDAPHPRSMTFATPFARQHDLAASMLKTSGRLLPGAAFGVGGRSDLHSARLPWIQIGTYRMVQPDANFAIDAKGGAFARRDLAGILGGEILRRFRVTLDYSRARMILEPGRCFADPFETDASGLLLKMADPSFAAIEVMDVIKDTPASDAGIRAGDLITAFDGKPLSEITLWEVRSQLRKAPREYELTVRRNDRIQKAVLRTRKLI